MVSFNKSADDQWTNCDYNAHYTVSVFAYGGQPSVSYDFEHNGRKTLSLAGTCEKH